MTQQTACSFGQAWPSLVYLPICSYFDGTVRHQLGLDDTRGYWTTVAPHEVAHQWWGHAVGWQSYRDQWMSEGFAEFSASLFLQIGMQDQDKFRKFWHDELELITEKNKEGFRAIDVGPLTAGYRLSNARVGFSVARRLIYPKGGFVLHMVRMMMWDRKTGDQRFREMMHDFVGTYRGRTASTEDFKAMVEKHMTPAMDLEGNHRMDWFFDQYVHGTALPRYESQISFGNGADGNVVMKVKVTQSEVDPKFQMLVPIYLEMAKGGVIRLGSVRMLGNSTFEQDVPIPGLKEMPKRGSVNYFYDVLASE